MTQSKKNITIALFLTSIFLLGILYAFIASKPKTTSSLLIAPTPSIKQAEKWVTYTNDKYGFSVKCNPSCRPEVLNESSQQLLLVGFGTLKNNGFDIQVTSGDDIGYYKNQIEDHIGPIEKEVKITVDGVVGIKLTYKQVIVIDQYDVSQVIVRHGGYDYIITALASDIDSILSAFKFTH